MDRDRGHIDIDRVIAEVNQQVANGAAPAIEIYFVEIDGETIAVEYEDGHILDTARIDVDEYIDTVIREVSDK